MAKKPTQTADKNASQEASEALKILEAEKKKGVKGLEERIKALKNLI